MSELLNVVMMLVGVFIAGFWCGGALAYWRWSSNAEELQRIEYMGKLYKVTRDE